MKKGDEIDLGLELAARHSKRGRGMSRENLAIFCNCKPVDIERVERGAMFKLRLIDSLRALVKEHRDR